MKHLRNVSWIGAIIIAFVVGAMISPFRSNHREGPASREEAAGTDSDSQGVLRAEGSLEIAEGAQIQTSAIAPEEFKRRILTAMMHADWLEQRMALFRVFESLSSENLQDAIATIEAFSDGIQKTNALGSLVSSWAAFDPHGALDYSLNGIGGWMGRILASQAIRVWAARDPQIALAWVKEHDEPEGQFSLISMVVAGWATNSLSEAEAYTKSLPKGPARKDAIAQITFQHWVQDPDLTTKE